MGSLKTGTSCSIRPPSTSPVSPPSPGGGPAPDLATTVLPGGLLPWPRGPSWPCSWRRVPRHSPGRGSPGMPLHSLGRSARLRLVVPGHGSPPLRQARHGRHVGCQPPVRPGHPGTAGFPHRARRPRDNAVGRISSARRCAVLAPIARRRLTGSAHHVFCRLKTIPM